MKRKALQKYVVSIDDAVRRCESRLSMLEARPQPAPDQWPQWAKNDTEMVWGSVTTNASGVPGLTLTAEQVRALRDLRDRLNDFVIIYYAGERYVSSGVSMAREVIAVLDQILGEPQ